MISRVLDYVQKHQMIKPGDHIAAGVSGGADSVCLLFVLDALRKELSFALTAVHVEHGIRGEESLRDAAFVEQLCRERKIPCRIFHVDARAEAQKKGMSLEEAGRELRYACFSKVCMENGANKIAVAHHRDDQAETVLFHLFRGTGLRGLGGMAPVRGNVIRPLLDTSREDIEAWLAAQGSSWCTDRTNLETEYARNKLRLKVLPYVEREIQPRAAEHVARAAERMRQVQEYLDQKAEEAYTRCMGKGIPASEPVIPGAVAGQGMTEGQKIQRICVDLKEFRQLEPLMRTMVLQLALVRMGRGLKDISAVHLEELLLLAEKDSGKEITLPHGIRARREYEKLILEIVPLTEKGRAQNRVIWEDAHKWKQAGNRPEGILAYCKEVQVPGVYEIQGLKWQFSLENAKKNRIIPEKTYTKWFDYDKIIQCLNIRNRQPGDFLEINREHGRKKLKDYLIDNKIPRDKRERLLLLAEGQHVLWIPGMRISEAYKVTEQTRRLLKVEIFGGETNDRESQSDDSGSGSGCEDRRAGKENQ